MRRTSKELKRISRDMLNQRYAAPMGAFVTASLISTVIETPFSMSLGDHPSTAQFVIFCIAEFLILLIRQILQVGVMQMHLNMTRGKSYRVRDMFHPFRLGTEQFFFASFLCGLLTLIFCIPVFLSAFYLYHIGVTPLSVGLLALAGLFSLALVVCFTLNYHLVFLFLLDYPQMKVRDAFHECRRLMRGNRRRLLGILFSFLGWGILILCSLGIASLWASPYMTQTLIIFYLDCTGELDRLPIREYNAQTRRFSNPFF